MNQTVNSLRKKLIVGVSSAVFLFVAGGATITMFTAHAYAGTCSKLSGFPGLVQRMGLVAIGGCATKPGGTICGGGSACTVGGNAGVCKNTAAVGSAPVCTCVQKTVSKLN